MLTNNLGQWDTRGLSTTSSNLPTLFSRRENLHNSTLKLAAYDKDHCSRQSFIHGSFTVVHCVHQLLWLLLANKLNFTTEYFYITTNIRFRDLCVNHPDIHGSIEAHTMSPADKRHTHIWPTAKSQLEMFTKYLGQEMGWKTYLGPFTITIWSLILAWILLAGLVIRFVSWATPTPRQVYVHTWMPYAAFCNQGSPVLPSQLTQRLVVVLSLMVPAVLVPAYSASLTSFLAIQQPIMPFTDLEGLSRHPEYRFGAWKTFNVNSYLYKDESPLAQRLLRNILPIQDHPETQVEGVARMCSSKFSFLDIIYSLQAIRPPCMYFKLNHPFLTFYTSMPLATNSPYNNLLNRYARTIRFTGVLQTMKNRAVMADLNEATDSGVHGEHAGAAITLDNTVVLFVIVLAGLILATCILILEMVYKRYSKQAGQNKIGI